MTKGLSHQEDITILVCLPVIKEIQNIGSKPDRISRRNTVAMSPFVLGI
jgi:hypothetical protein